jgi:hypothetical protein
MKIMQFKKFRKKPRKLSFIERAYYLPKTYRYIESFLENYNKAYDY